MHTHTNAAGVAALIQLLWRLERAATCSVPLLSNAFDYSLHTHAGADTKNSDSSPHRRTAGRQTHQNNVGTEVAFHQTNTVFKREVSTEYLRCAAY